jgi:hypothetical protein
LLEANGGNIASGASSSSGTWHVARTHHHMVEQLHTTYHTVCCSAVVQVWKTEKHDFDELTEQEVHKGKTYEALNALAHFW